MQKTVSGGDGPGAHLRKNILQNQGAVVLRVTISVKQGHSAILAFFEQPFQGILFVVLLQLFMVAVYKLIPILRIEMETP